MSDLLPLLAAVVGAIVGGAIAYVNVLAQSRQRDRTERRNLRLGKIEEVYQLVMAVRRDVTDFYLEAVSHLDGRHVDRIDRRDSLNCEDRLQRLVRLYFPELDRFRGGIAGAIHCLRQQAVLAVEARGAPMPKPLQAQIELSQSIQHVDERCDEFIREVHRLVESLLPTVPPPTGACSRRRP